MSEPDYGYCTCGHHASDQCQTCEDIKRGKEPAEVQIERRLDYVIREMDDLCALASHSETVGLVAGQKAAIGQVLFRAQLIASFLLANEPPKFKVISNVG